MRNLIVIFFTFLLLVAKVYAQLFGGQSFSSRSNFQNQYPAGTVFCNGATAIIDVTNPSTGNIWMDRNLGASQVSTISSDPNSFGDLYQWGRGSDGHQCRTSTTTSTLSSSDQPGNNNFIISTNSPNDWRNPQSSNLWQGVNGINNPCPNGYRVPTDAELNGERLSWSVNNLTGAFSSPLKFSAAGSRDCINGLIAGIGTNGRYWSSSVSVSGANAIDFDGANASQVSDFRAIGRSVRCIKEISGTVGSLDCGNAITNGNIFIGQPVTNVTVDLPYTSGNGGYYPSQVLNSSGATGLIASLSSGFYNNGSGNLNFSISGTPLSSGIASFLITLGGQSCTLNVVVYPPQPPYPTGSIFCTGSLTIVNDVVNPSTGKTWMDRNLGASRMATSATDINAYGDLYQWGRGNDGHQCRNSPTTTTISSSDQPGNNNFIRSSGNASTPPFSDWRSPQNINLWQGANGINNPCPSGYRIPTDAEMITEPYNSPIKLTLAGNRTSNAGALSSVGINGYYWTSTTINTNSYYVLYTSAGSGKFNNFRAFGYSVRCIKN